MHPTQIPMPFCKPQAKLFADQNHAQHERAGTGRNMRIERPLVTAKEIMLPPMQKIGFKIRRHVIAVTQEHANDHPAYQYAHQQFQDTLQRYRAEMMHFT